MEILYACNQLRVDLRSLLLLEPCVSHDEVKQLAAVSVLHNHEKFLVSLDDLLFSVVEREWGGGDLPQRVGLRWGGELSLEF